MLIPLTDSTNPYTAMMLELIASHDDHPHSHRWEAPRDAYSPRRRRLPFVGRFLPRRRTHGFAHAV
jgi:hypothetical protein